MYFYFLHGQFVYWHSMLSTHRLRRLAIRQIEFYSKFGKKTSISLRKSKLKRTYLRKIEVKIIEKKRNWLACLSGKGVNHFRVNNSHVSSNRNAFHGLYTIAKNEGLSGIQKGLVPGLWYQMTMNGLRLGTFQILTNLGYTTSPDGEYSFPRNIAASALAGGVATWVGSPFYLVGPSNIFDRFLQSCLHMYYISTWLYIQDFVDMFWMHIGLKKYGKDISL